MRKAFQHLKSKICLLFFIAFGCLIVSGQTTAPSASPETKPIPTASPAAAQIPPENKAEIEKINQELRSAQILLSEGQQSLAKVIANALPAREKLNQALTLSRSVNAKTKDKNFLLKISQSGETANQSLNVLKILEFYSKVSEALSLDAIAQTHTNLSEWQKSVDIKKQAVEVYQEILSDTSFKSEIKAISDLKNIYAQDLFNIGQLLDAHFGKLDEALQYFNRAIDSFRALYGETQNSEYKLQEAIVLASIGHAYHRESKNNEKALEFFNKSLEIYKSSPNEKEKIADILSSVASVHFVNFDFKNALENWEKALTVYREIDNKKGQSRVLNQIGLAHQSLNNKTKAAEYANQNLAILQSPDFNQNWRRGIDKQEFASLGESFAWFIEHFRLRSIAETYELLENYPKSLESYEKALAVADSSKNSRTIRLTANKVAFAFAKLEKWDKAAEYYKKGLEISRAQGVLEDLADDLKDVGWALLEGGKPAEALEFQNEALSVYQSVGIGENRAFTPAYSTLLNEISRSHYALGNKRLAIFYGKRAVNAMQGERKRLQNLDSVSQKGFLETKEKHYRRLADWLIAEGRIVETEQVLAMLKNEEVSSYLRRDVSEADKLQKRTDLTASEKNALARYYQIADKIAAIGAEYDKLREKLQELQKQGVMPPPEQQNRYNELSEQVKAANNIFQAFLKQLADEFARRGDTKKDLAENLALQSDLKDLGEGVVFLYTLVGENRYRVILTAPQIKTDGKYEIKSVELDKKISDFRQIVRNPNLDPRPLGKELYDILIKPIEKGLDGAKAKTLLWSLDGNLRLLPLAALWDGKQYFGQKYQNVIFTLASRSRLKDAVSTDWRILGLGVSEAKTVIAKDVGGKTRNVPFYALPAVTKELASIVADEKNKTGILPGQILLNADFTEKNFQRQLLESYKVVHIASHFALNAGDATESFLLLGDGNALTLSEIKINPELDFAGVELLTLSACETAVAGKDSNGKEIEGFAYVAQQKGAKAILATLWSVADESTRLLMSEFYRLRKENPKLTKAEALQIAQNQMIDGKVQSLESSTGNKKGSESKVKAPQFLIDNQKPFAHPFYWSPFILIGNWK